MAKFRQPAREQAVSTQNWWKKAVRRPLSWLLAGAVAASTGVLIATLTSIPAQLVDVPALEDSIRSGQDIQATVDILNDDGSWTMAHPGRYDLASDDPLLRGVSERAADTLVRKMRLAGGMDVNRLRVRILFEGRRSQEIQIVNVGLTDIERLPPVRGTLVDLGYQGSGVAHQQIAFDLNDPLPAARKLDPDGKVGDPYFKNYSISLHDREQVILLVNLRVRNQTAKFRLKADYLIGGEMRSIRIDHNGVPFQVTSVVCNPDGSETGDYYHAYRMDSVDSVGQLGLKMEPDPHHTLTGMCLKF